MRGRCVRTSKCKWIKDKRCSLLKSLPICRYAIEKDEMKRYWILSVNCDGPLCGHHYEARLTSRTGEYNVIRCEFDGRPQGLGDWFVVGRIEAKGKFDAVDRWKAMSPEDRRKMAKKLKEELYG